MPTSAASPRSSLTVRRIPFEFPADVPPRWHPTRPEWSHMVNGASLVMPYLEPYLIQAVRRALPKIIDDGLRTEANDYCAQEGQHYRQHKRFNDTLVANGYEGLSALEARMQRTYDGFLERRSLRFHLAYAAGFESMALSVGHWLVDDRVFLFGDADPRVASLVLWHFVEEIEHKNAALDVYHAVTPGYAWRIFGLFYASFHVMALSRRAYRAMLVRDGLWYAPRSRWRLWMMVGRFLRRTIPHMLRCCLPGHDPRTFPDPPWVRAWVRAYGADAATVPMLDTHDLTASLDGATGTEGFA